MGNLLDQFHGIDTDPPRNINVSFLARRLQPGNFNIAEEIDPRVLASNV